MNVGETWRVFYQKDNQNNRRFHVRAIVDGGIVVSRTWSRSHQCWRYNCEPLDYFEYMIERGWLKKVKSA